MNEGPPPRHLYPQLSDLIAATQKSLKKGHVPEADLKNLREIDSFFLIALGRNKIEIGRAHGAIGALVLWNLVMTVAVIVLCWAAFIR